MPIDVVRLTDQELDTLIDNHRRLTATDRPIYADALRERERRWGKGLDCDKAFAIIRQLAQELRQLQGWRTRAALTEQLNANGGSDGAHTSFILKHQRAKIISVRKSTMQKMLLGATVSVILTGGCAVTSDPIQIGKDTYTSSASWGWSSSSSLRTDLYKEASAFCARQGKVMDALQGTGHDSGYAQWASAEVTFRCLDAADPEYTPKQMQFQPNVRIQVTE